MPAVERRVYRGISIPDIPPQTRRGVTVEISEVNSARPKGRRSASASPKAAMPLPHNSSAPSALTIDTISSPGRKCRTERAIVHRGAEEADTGSPGLKYMP